MDGPGRPAFGQIRRMILVRRGYVGASASPSPDPDRDSPVPRLSNRISRENVASRSKNRAIVGSSQAASTWDTQPGTQTRSRGPSPITWYAIDTPSGVLA